ncbi:FAD-binding protein [Kitasatospora sp. NPDC001664]
MLSGWGRTAPSPARVVIPGRVEQIRAAVSAAGPRGILARGLGRAYGDAAQNAGGSVLDMTACAAIRSFDVPNGLITADAGLSLHQLMRAVLPFGWFPPVTPGTRMVTLGGAVAADVHGKNHHVSGGFTNHVTEFDLVTADGALTTVLPGSELFAATAGGMGLTGVITSVTLRLLPVRSSLMTVDTERVGHLDVLMDRLKSGDHHYRYSVAWIDLLARGSAMGRAVITRGDHAPAEALPPAARRDPLLFRPSSLPGAPHLPGGLLRPSTVRAFNQLWYRKAPRFRRDELQTISTFFHPLDGLPDWNRIYGPAGFLQYQFVVADGQEETLRRIVERISRASCPTFLAVLKRFGPAGPGWLSFPVPGWTLALDLPTRTPGLNALLDELDSWVAEAGGRVYLAKDSRLRPATLRAMYPRLDDFRSLRRALDPNGVFTSDLARRLAL